MTSYVFDAAASRLSVHASSSIHGIDTDADGVEGALDLTVGADGTIDLSQPVTGSLRFDLARLSSGNPLYDRETERRIDVKRYPTVEASVAGVRALGAGEEPGTWRYQVDGSITFHGVTQDLDGEIALRATAEVIELSGEEVLDVRAWQINPPKLGLLKVHPDIRVRLDVVAKAPEPNATVT